MLDLFGRNRKSLKDMMDELNDMVGGFEPMFIKGETKSESGTDSNGDWTKETFTSKDGTYQVTSYVRTYGSTSKPKESDELTSLRKELDLSIESQEFEKACELRDKIKTLEANKDKINELQTQLDKAISEQNFEDAIKLRDQIKKLNS